MTADEARYRLRELVRLRQDVERFQRGQSALTLCPEIKSSAAQQAANCARASLLAADAQERELVRLLTGTASEHWSDADLVVTGEAGHTVSRM